MALTLAQPTPLLQLADDVGDDFRHLVVGALLRALDELEEDIGEHHQAIVQLMGSYLGGGHPFPERTHLSVLFATFQIDIFKTIERWIEFARTEIAGWPTTRDLGMTPRIEAITRLLADDRTPVND